MNTPTPPCPRQGYRVVEMRDAIREAMEEEMARDERIFLLGEEVAEYNGAYKVSRGMLERWGPRRVLDTPISESAFAGLAIGAAMTGLKPIVEFMSFNFSFVAADQILSNAAKIHYMSGGRFSVPIVFRGPNGAAAQVSCQHSHCVEALYSHFPGLIVVAPSTPYDAKGLLKSAIRNNNPVLFLESELLYGQRQEIPIAEYLVPLGKASVVRSGSDLTLISHSRMVHLCLQAAEELAKEGLSVEVIDLRSLKPLDLGTLVGSVKKTHRALVVEEGHRCGGIAAEVIAQLQELVLDELDGPIGRLCQRETPMPYSKVLEAATLPSVQRIIERCRFQIIGKEKGRRG